jgi:hypothetical protein
MLSILHGASIVKMLGILFINWKLARLALHESSESGKGGIRKEWVPYLTWGFNGGILFLNEIYGGYSFGSISSSLSWLVSLTSSIQFPLLSSLTALHG